jgi:tetratricopeptide (TPR) repeat protein
MRMAWAWSTLSTRAGAQKGRKNELRPLKRPFIETPLHRVPLRKRNHWELDSGLYLTGVMSRFSLNRILQTPMADKRRVAFEARFDKYLDNEQWARAYRATVAQIRKEPKDHGLYFYLGFVLHAWGRISEAARASARGLKLSPQCPLLLASHAEHIGALGRYREAIRIFERLVRSGVRRLARAECGEGLPWARNIICDSHICLAMLYSTIGRFSVAARHHQAHVRLRQRSTSGYPASFLKKIKTEIDAGQKR